jgi:hydroxyethylthiazole kinase-like uncharacterized protein yjeF
MEKVTLDDLKTVYKPSSGSHKGQNGKLLVIGGSHLFHAASLWSLTVASRIVDLVHYCSVPENNEMVVKAKEEFKNGIVVPRTEVEAYVKEDDCILIGPGMTRDEETKSLTDNLLRKFPDKQWVIDAGALQMMDISLIPKNAILTPHRMEFEGLMQRLKNAEIAPHSSEANVGVFAAKNNCIVLLKGQADVACAPDGNCREIAGGNAGMTKGGTGDVLAGLIAALACNNEPFLATIAGSFLNKAAGDELFRTVGPFFNATDLANEIPKVMKQLLYA